jgi:repressor LexA
MQHAPRNLNTRKIILQFIMEYAKENGRQPSVREIGTAANLSSLSTIAGYLRRMKRDGLLECEERFGRKYFVAAKANEFLRAS